MRRAGDRLAARAPDARGEPIGDLAEVAHVVLAGHDQRGRADLGQALARALDQQLVLGVVPERQLELEGTALHRAHPCADLGIGVRRAVEPEAQVELRRSIDVLGLEQLLLTLEERVHLRRPLVVGERRVGEDEPLDQLRTRQRQVERDEAAERGADERRGRGVAALEQLGDVAGVREALGAQLAAAVAAQVAAQG